MTCGNLLYTGWKILEKTKWYRTPHRSWPQIHCLAPSVNPIEHDQTWIVVIFGYEQFSCKVRRRSQELPKSVKICFQDWHWLWLEQSEDRSCTADMFTKSHHFRSNTPSAVFWLLHIFVVRLNMSGRKSNECLHLSQVLSSSRLQVQQDFLDSLTQPEWLINFPCSNGFFLPNVTNVKNHNWESEKIASFLKGWVNLFAQQHTKETSNHNGTERCMLLRTHVKRKIT